ncbi:MAG: serine/threonine protein kinase [Deltaproteobacteria bacterium]|nr:serine/threonine protein kinase [Deltaproteobacteria bacterium]
MPWFCVECGKVNPDGVEGCRACKAPMPVNSVRISSARFRAPDGVAPARPSLADGASVGRYRLEQHIASGGFATVHLARDTRTGAEVALKVLASNLVHNQKLVARFHQEARIQSSLLHPGVVRVFEVVEDAGSVALVMEYVRGVPLDGLLDQLGRPLAPFECCEILVPMLDALEYAHRAGVVHRDLKPSNVLLQANPDLPLGYWPKIADFGIAKVLDEGGVRTATGLALGTKEYMAPEQCKGERSVDHRADVYATGVMLFEMVTRTLPFTGTVYEVFEGHIRQAPPRPTVLNPAVAPALENVILQALEKDPGERFQSAVALRDALQASRVSAASWPGAAQAPAVGIAVTHADGDDATRARRRLLYVAAGVLVGALLAVITVVLASKGTDQGTAARVADGRGGSDVDVSVTLDDRDDEADGAWDAPRDARDAAVGERVAVPAAPTAPYWRDGSDPCSAAECLSDWPVCYLDGARCNNTNCGECAEDLLKRVSQTPSNLAKAWCIGKMIADRADDPDVARSTADRYRREGWGWQLMGRALDLRNCPGAVEYYATSARKRSMALDFGWSDDGAFLTNRLQVERWCREHGEIARCSVRP